MGAGASGLIRQFLAEGLLISAAGSAVGLGIAVVGTKMLLAAGSDSIPRAAEVAIDWRVLLFTGAVLAATAVIFGLAPLT
jgi:ABC-type antimicrobial peptide transport system permease subunit